MAASGSITAISRTAISARRRSRARRSTIRCGSASCSCRSCSSAPSRTSARRSLARTRAITRSPQASMARRTKRNGSSTQSRRASATRTARKARRRGHGRGTSPSAAGRRRDRPARPADRCITSRSICASNRKRAYAARDGVVPTRECADRAHLELRARSATMPPPRLRADSAGPAVRTFPSRKKGRTNAVRLSSPLILALVAPYAAAQTSAPASAASEVRYVGATTRLGIGYDSDNRLRGDWSQVFGEDPHSAWIGQLWASNRGAGGAQLSYHWQPAAVSDAPVRKLFVAVDQNRDHDRKVSVGGGIESARGFVNGYASAAITGRREIGFESTTTITTTTGVDAGRPFEQDVFTTVDTRRFERAYDYGVGVRAGHFYTGALVRLEAGGDYEWGRGNASQATVSLGVEKFFEGSPHSVGVVAEAYHKRGDFETARNDHRVVAMYRYSFGGPQWRPEREYRTVRAETPAPAAAVAPAAAPAPQASPAAPQAPRIERRLVKTTATAAADAFFDLDRATLRPDARAALDSAIAKLKAAGFEGNIRVVGHTCNLGTAPYNQKLSERRAAAVRDYLVAGGLPADRILAEGHGLPEPRYPQIEWRREEIASEPTWLRRALRDPVRHKQSVDVYRTQTQTTTVTAGERRFLNRAPIAAPDAFTVEADSSATAFDVLANDSDPDGDAIALATLTAPAHGTATIAGGRIAYTPSPGYVGADAFIYTIRDAQGLTATTSVAITVVRTNHAPIARDDFASSGFQMPVSIDVLANDSDPDGDPLTITSFTQPDSGKARVTRGPNNTLVYQPTDGFVGFDYFQYTVSDGKGGTATANVRVYADP